MQMLSKLLCEKNDTLGKKTTRMILISTSLTCIIFDNLDAYITILETFLSIDKTQEKEGYINVHAESHGDQICSCKYVLIR